MSRIARTSRGLGVNRLGGRAGVPAARPPSVAVWTGLCAAAETLGMTAAAGAAKTSQAMLGEPTTGREVGLALSLVVAGGLVEGTALGALQAVGLRHVLPAPRRRAWLLVTVAVAGLGWAAASAPAVLTGLDGGSPPGWLLVLGGAALLGAIMGAVLGTVQAAVLHSAVRFPWRWVGASALAWAPAMVVIFAGATTPGADWSVLAVLALGALTGTLAGAVLGLVSGWFLPSLDGASLHNRVVLALLRGPAHRLVDRALVGLRVWGRRSGRRFELPVMYAPADPPDLVVIPGRAATKSWWRNLRQGARVDVLRAGRWEAAWAAVVEPGDEAYADALAAYRRRWPRTHVTAGTPMVLVRRFGEWSTAGRRPR